MRYEAKHSYSKKLAQNVGNFINVPWTLAMRHQLWQCYQWMNSDTLSHDKTEVGLLTLHGHMDPTNSLPFNSVGDTVGQLDMPEVLRSSGHEFYK